MRRDRIIPHLSKSINNNASFGWGNDYSSVESVDRRSVITRVVSVRTGMFDRDMQVLMLASL